MLPECKTISPQCHPTHPPRLSDDSNLECTFQFLIPTQANPHELHQLCGNDEEGIAQRISLLYQWVYEDYNSPDMYQLMDLLESHDLDYNLGEVIDLYAQTKVKFYRGDLVHQFRSLLTKRGLSVQQLEQFDVKPYVSADLKITVFGNRVYQ